MITDLFNITRVQLEGAPNLFPQGIDWTVKAGINTIVGGTGLGKTTLLNAMLFTLAGPLGKTNPRAQQLTEDYFSGRLGATPDTPARMTVHARFAEHAFQVSRDLLSGKLLEFTVDGEDKEIGDYQATVCQTLGIDDFEAHFSRVIDSLLYASDAHYLLAWDNKTQNEILNLLFAPTKDFDKVVELWSAAASADSQFRNVRHQASIQERQLQELLSKRPEATDTISAKRDALVERRKSAESHRSLTAAAEDAARLKMAELDRATNEQQDSFQDSLTWLSSHETVDLDESLEQLVFSSPLADSVYWGVRKIAESKGESRCPCCARVPQADSATLRAIRTALKSEACPVCSLALEPMPNTRKEVGESEEVKRVRKEAAELAVRLQETVATREAARSRLNHAQRASREAEEELQRCRDAEWEFRAQHPAAGDVDVEQRKIALNQLRESATAAESRMKRLLGQFEKQQEKVRGRLEELYTGLARKFGEYCGLFLDETCTVEFDPEGDKAKRSGPQINPSHAAFYPVLSHKARYRPTDLSEAQRLFVDLAFRMAVLDVWREQTKGSATLIIETPEGTVDIAYMVRVAEMLARFGASGHTVILTTNLNNDALLAGVLKAVPKKSRESRILNLLERGVPRPLQVAHKKRFDKMIKAAIEGQS